MMKAAVWTPAGTLELREMERPELHRADEVLVRVRASGICGSDLHSWRVPRPDRVGTVTGHELAGEVVEVGEAVEHVQPGDRVAVESLVECGTCRWCRVGRYHLCPELSRLRRASWSRGFSQFVKGPSRKLFTLEGHVKTEWAPLLDCYAVNVHAFQVSRLKLYETIAVIGQGPMGLTMTDLANAVGVKVIALALRDFPLSVARAVGAWATVNSRQVDPVATVLDLTAGYGVDTTFVQVGGTNPNPLNQAMRMTKKGGKVMIVGMTTGGHVVRDFDTARLRSERSVQYVNNFAYWDGYSENAIALDFLTRGRLHPADIITHRFPLDAINDAFDTAADKKTTNAIKVLITQHEA
jgi:threonine dehydrogenase-like Zn-dependent dehydrogenase